MVAEKYVKCANFVDKQVGDELILVPLANQVAHMGEVFTLNEVGAYIWQCLEIPLTLSQLVEKLTDAFDVDPDKARNDVEQFLEQTRAKNIILRA